MKENKKIDLTIYSDQPLFKTRLLYYLLAQLKQPLSPLATLAAKKQFELSFYLADTYNYLETDSPIGVEARYDGLVQEVARVRRHDVIYYHERYQEKIEIHHTVLDALVAAAIIRYLTDFNYQPKPKLTQYADAGIDENNPNFLLHQGKQIQLQPMEFKLLKILIKQPLKQMSYEQISDLLYDDQQPKDRKYLRVLVSQLNKVLNAHRVNIRIKAVRFYGYRIVAVRQD